MLVYLSVLCVLYVCGVVCLCVCAVVGPAPKEKKKKKTPKKKEDFSCVTHLEGRNDVFVDTAEWSAATIGWSAQCIQF